MILQDVWQLMNEILRGDFNTEVDKKMLALNQGYLYLAKLMIENGTYLQELVSAPVSIATTDGVNQLDLPEDYLALMFLWYKSGSTYVPVMDEMLVDYAYLLKQAYNNFLDTTAKGTPNLFAINEPNIFTDIRWSDTDAHGVKIMYHKKPTELIAYDEIKVVSTTGFTVGEVVLQTTTNASGTINTINATNKKITVLTNSRSGVFYNSYNIVGQTSSTTSAQVGDMVEKPQELEISDKLKLELATAGALQYLYMEDNPEAEIKSKTLQQLIRKNNVISKSNIDYTIRIG